MHIFVNVSDNQYMTMYVNYSKVVCQYGYITRVLRNDSSHIHIREEILRSRIDEYSAIRGVKYLLLKYIEFKIFRGLEAVFQIGRIYCSLNVGERTNSHICVGFGCSIFGSMLSEWEMFAAKASD